MLYLFAGKPRQGDMTQCLQQQAAGRKLHITCVDIQRKPSIDLAKSKERQRLLTRIRAQEFDAILLSPPCSTFSRAPWANFKGPRPVRSAARPRGLDKLTAAERDRCILGNMFAEVVELAILPRLHNQPSMRDRATTYVPMDSCHVTGYLLSYCYDC